MKKITACFAAVLLIAFGALAADAGLVVYRGLDGRLTDMSVQNLYTLRNLAARNGRIVVWVDFDIPFEVDPALRTPEVIAENEASRQAAMAEVVAPLIATGAAEELDLESQAPGCLLSVSQRALRDLARNPKVKHIGHFPTETD